MSSIHREATRLLYKAMNLTGSPSTDSEYRDLLHKFRADLTFSLAVQEAAIGLELHILDVSERGLIVAPSSKESRFSLRMADLRGQFNAEQKVALAMAHLAISAVFFPTTDRLDDDAKAPLPATLARFRDTLLGIVNRLSDAQGSDETADVAEDLVLGWQYLKRLPAVNPKAERASASSLDGFVRIAVNRMVEYGLLRMAREGEDEALSLFTATHRLRVHLRELTLPRLFHVTRDAANAAEAL
ncbi:hypothetical protein [Herbaspirillum frisingense]|uniref:Uncharacterized protein n=1 Tax=Herbaspirillum frisingense TaxID=92645 RepID=A0ABU1PIB2_9BURK|nr:hypothetical protein [Herbaspirillum frisingense]MDR6585646.1 hypothetical protein [Herbaspirillum frisingense]